MATKKTVTSGEVTKENIDEIAAFIKDIIEHPDKYTDLEEKNDD